jgi:hypothetical protein
VFFFLGKGLGRVVVHNLEIAADVFELDLFVEFDPLENEIKFFLGSEVSYDGGAVGTAEAEADDVSFGWFGRNTRLPCLSFGFKLLTLSLLFFLLLGSLFRKFLILLDFFFYFHIGLVLLLDLLRIVTYFRKINLLFFFLFIVVSKSSAYEVSVFDYDVAITFIEIASFVSPLIQQDCVYFLKLFCATDHLEFIEEVVAETYQKRSFNVVKDCELRVA